MPDEVKTFFKARAEEGAALRTAWESRFDDWRERHRETADVWDAVCGREVPEEHHRSS